MPLIRAARLFILAVSAGVSLPVAAQDPLAQALDARQRDPATAACMDFYQHANGGWLAATPVPAGMGSFGYTDQVRAVVAAQQRELLQGFIARPEDDLDALIGRVYALGMDTAATEAAGLGAAAGFLQRIDAASKPKELPLLIAELHGWGAPILFAFSAGADLQQPQEVIAYANQAGLGLPDRDYYLREDAAALELLGAYRSYVERLLNLAGRTQAAAEAEQVLRLEIELARASLSLEQLRDPLNSYRPTAVRELERSQPNLRWKDYLRAQGLRGVDSLSLAHVSYFGALNSLLISTPLADWQAYLRFHVLHSAAPFLGEAFVAAHDQLYLATLAGQQPPERETRVLQLMQRSLGDAVGQRYARRFLQPPRREAAVALAEALRAELRKRIAAADWMTEEGRSALLTDLDGLAFALGGPASSAWEGWKLEATTYADAVLSMSRYRHAQQLAQIGKPPALRWPLPSSALQTAYDSTSNTLYLPAGLLQSPLFEPAGDRALNYGGAGVLIGRGLSAAFDLASGPRRGRVSEADRQTFAARATALVAQYSAFSALGPIQVDGAATWAQNLADLGGLQLAYAGFAEAGGEADASADAISPAQRYFHAWARLQRRNYQDEALRLQLASDVRAPARFRVNGPLPHLSEFQAAFACDAGAPMSLPEAARARLW